MLLVACSPTGEAAATEACSRFVDLSGEQSILTDAEIRARVQDIYDLAQASDDQDLTDGTHLMLAGITDHDDSTYQSGWLDTYDACGL